MLQTTTILFAGICGGIFKDDPITRDEVAVLVDTFPGQSIYFFVSLRSRIYDDVIWEYVSNTGVALPY